VAGTDLQSIRKTPPAEAGSLLYQRQEGIDLCLCVGKQLFRPSKVLSVRRIDGILGVLLNISANLDDLFSPFVELL
jgi:hypothetical protein